MFNWVNCLGWRLQRESLQFFKKNLYKFAFWRGQCLEGPRYQALPGVLRMTVFWDGFEEIEDRVWIILIFARPHGELHNSI